MKISKDLKIRLVKDFLYRSAIHFTQWYYEVKHQLGEEKSFEILSEVWTQSQELKTRRWVNFYHSLNNKNLLEISDNELNELLQIIAKSWLANDGIWFQAVEFKYGLNEAKRCNDSCWAQFSPIEAWSIKKLLGMEKQPGIEGLEKALFYRLYAFINEQEIAEKTKNRLVFRMNRCRVQEARQRKSLPDYPCKSAGIVEYSRFAESIDSRIKTRVIACPPDPHPAEWFCAWEFTIE